MKIINEKGKLFGLINIIDLSVLVILILLVVGGVSRMKGKPIVASESTEGIISFEVEDVRMPSVENVKVGDPLYHYDKGDYLGEIIEVSHEPYKEPLESGDGKWINAEVPEKYIINFKIKADVKDSPDIVIVGGEQVRIGSQFRLKNKRVGFFATALEIDVK